MSHVDVVVVLARPKEVLAGETCQAQKRRDEDCGNTKPGRHRSPVYRGPEDPSSHFGQR
jgi:hypothetical protein